MRLPTNGRPDLRPGQLPFRDYLDVRNRERVADATRHLSFTALLALTDSEVSSLVTHGYTRTDERIYGAAMFLLRHWITERDRAKGDRIVKHVRGVLAGRLLVGLPEARRVYLALCERRGVAPDPGVL